VDAKAALQHYLEAVEAQDDAARTRTLDAHARQVRQHFEDLASRRYWEQFEASPEFVVLFLPGEPFLGAALQRNLGLIEYAIERAWRS
jgi:DNA recombination protein RmuC